MAVLNIIKIGDSDDHILYEKAEKILKIEDHYLNYAKDMIDTMMSADGIGLAANQIGILERIIVLTVQNDNGTGTITTMFNPEITFFSEEKDKATEGCLSIPKVREIVERSKEIIVRYLNKRDRIVERKFSGLTARCVQHEIDHLDGILFTTKIEKEN